MVPAHLLTKGVNSLSFIFLSETNAIKYYDKMLLYFHELCTFMSQIKSIFDSIVNVGVYDLIGIFISLQGKYAHTILHPENKLTTMSSKVTLWML